MRHSHASRSESNADWHRARTCGGAGRVGPLEGRSRHCARRRGRRLRARAVRAARALTPRLRRSARREAAREALSRAHRFGPDSRDRIRAAFSGVRCGGRPPAPPLCPCHPHCRASTGPGFEPATVRRVNYDKTPTVKSHRSGPHAQARPRSPPARRPGPGAGFNWGRDPVFPDVQNHNISLGQSL